MLEWLGALNDREASFLGSFIGPAVGLAALLLGALFNAHLNRRRDDRIRVADTRATAAALRAELNGLLAALDHNAESLATAESGFLVPDLAQSIYVFPEMLTKIGQLDVTTVNELIDAYIVIEQYAETLVLLGGQPAPNLPRNRCMLAMPKTAAAHVITINRTHAERLKRVIARLDGYLKQTS